jgi:hypothetical protein
MAVQCSEDVARRTPDLWWLGMLHLIPRFGQLLQGLPMCMKELHIVGRASGDMDNVEGDGIRLLTRQGDCKPNI